MIKELMNVKLFVLFNIGIAALIIIASLQSCGAQGDSTYAQSIPGPNGVSCYAIFQDGKVVGGNCVKN